ncbi:MAG: type II toxin-antitoxin system prevent-host-death family antitoxin [Rhizomicrobium sp.]
MRPVNIHAAKTHLSRLLEKAMQGEEIVIAKAGKPMAKLVSLKSAGGKRRRLGILAGSAQVPRGFAAPLPLGTLDGPEDA